MDDKEIEYNRLKRKSMKWKKWKQGMKTSDKVFDQINNYLEVITPGVQLR